MLGLNYFYVFSFSAIIFLLLVSAMVSASEVAFFSLKSDDLNTCKESEDPGYGKIVQLLTEPRLLLATILVIHDLVNVAIITIATFVMLQMSGTNNPSALIAWM